MRRLTTQRLTPEQEQARRDVHHWRVLALLFSLISLAAIVQDLTGW